MAPRAAVKAERMEAGADFNSVICVTFCGLVQASKLINNNLTLLFNTWRQQINLQRVPGCIDIELIEVLIITPQTSELQLKAA